MQNKIEGRNNKGPQLPTGRQMPNMEEPNQYSTINYVLFVLFFYRLIKVIKLG